MVLYNKMASHLFPWFPCQWIIKERITSVVSHQQEQVLDPKMRLMLYKLVTGEILEAVNGCISTGKETCVFHAHGGRFVQF